jgi:hypothetical protein
MLPLGTDQAGQGVVDVALAGGDRTCCLLYRST